MVRGIIVGLAVTAVATALFEPTERGARLRSGYSGEQALSRSQAALNEKIGDLEEKPDVQVIWRGTDERVPGAWRASGALEAIDVVDVLDLAEGVVAVERFLEGGSFPISGPSFWRESGAVTGWRLAGATLTIVSLLRAGRRSPDTRRRHFWACYTRCVSGSC